MKVCPKCDRDYGDEAGFCLIDGTALIHGDVMPTVAINAVAAPTEVLPSGSLQRPKGRRTTLFVVLGILAVLAAAVFSGVLLSKTARRGNDIRENRNIQKNSSSPTPTPAK